MAIVYVPYYPQYSHTTVLGSYTKAGIRKVERTNGGTLTTQRAKPVGVELLFNPTSYSRYSSHAIDRPKLFQGRLTWLNTVTKKYDSKPGLLFSSGYQSFGFGAPTILNSDTWSNSEILGRVKAERVNLALMLKEYRQTADLFADIALALRDTVRAVRKGRFRALLAKGTRNAPSTWLMYRYGLTPLLHDIQGCLDTLIQVDKNPLIRRVSLKRKSSQIVLSPRSYRPDANWDNMQRNVWAQRDQTCRWVAHVEYDAPELALASQLGLTNLPQFAWEIIPYSFVLDWFINVGDFLSNLDALQGVKRISVVKMRRYTSIEEFPNGMGRYDSYIREVVAPINSFPNWDPSLSWKRIVDSVALLHNLRR